MKKISLILALICLSGTFYAQSIKSENGIYYTSTGDLYSGMISNYDELGNKKSDIQVKDGKTDGESIYYYTNGKVMETGNYTAGLKAGMWIRYNENGAKTAVANFLNGKKNGTWMVWDDNGIKRYEMTYANGEKTGTWYNWDERGEVIASTLYSSGN